MINFLHHNHTILNHKKETSIQSSGRLRKQQTSGSVAAEGHRRKHDQEDEDDRGDERPHHRAAHALAEIGELLANGQPVGVGVAVVG